MLFAATNVIETAEQAAETACAEGAAAAEPGRGLADLALEWITHDGVAFATRAAVALVMLLVGWVAIRIVSAAVRRALTRGGRKRTLFTDFVSSVVTKVCWAVLAMMVLGRLGVAVRSGIQCAPYAHEFLGTLPSGTVRLSVSALSDEQDFAVMQEALIEIAEA